MKLQNLKSREQGEPNQVVIHTQDSKDWVAHILFNGVAYTQGFCLSKTDNDKTSKNL